MRIAKIAFSIACLLTCTIQALSQEIMIYGLKVGAVHSEPQWRYSQVSNVQQSGSKPIWGWDAGALLGLSIFRNIDLLAELHYLQRGRYETITLTQVANNPQGYVDLGLVQIKEKTDHLSIPIIGRFRFEYGKLEPYVCLGPRVEYLLSHPETPIYDQFRRWEFGGTVAAGLQLSLGFIPHLLLEATYNSDFTDAFRNGVVAVDNRSVGFSIGVLF